MYVSYSLFSHIYLLFIAAFSLPIICILLSAGVVLIFDDKGWFLQERVLSALESAGLFLTGGLTKDKVKSLWNLSVFSF